MAKVTEEADAVAAAAAETTYQTESADQVDSANLAVTPVSCAEARRDAGRRIGDRRIVGRSPDGRPLFAIGFLGFAADLLWLGWFARNVGQLCADKGMAAATWVAIGVFSLLVALVAFHRPGAVEMAQTRARLVDVLSSVGIMAASATLAILLPAGQSRMIALLVAVLAGPFIAMRLARWGEMLAAADDGLALEVLAIDAVALFSLKCLGSALESSASGIVLGLPVLLPLVGHGGLWLLRGLHGTGSQASPEHRANQSSGASLPLSPAPLASPAFPTYYTRENLPSLVGIVTFMALFSVVLKLLDVIVPTLRSGVSGVVVALLVFMAVGVHLFVLSRPLDFFGDVRALLVATSLAAVLCVFASGLLATCATGLVLAIRELTRFYLFLLQADIARHANVPAAAVFGVGWACCGLPRLPFVWIDRGMVEVPLVGDASGVGALIALLILVMLVMAFALIKPPAGMRAPLSEPAPLEPYAMPVPGDSTDVVGDVRTTPSRRDVLLALAAEHDLTERESEIFELLCAGRSRGYIADTLFISENTVKFHTKNVYRKMGVTSKQELLDVCEEALR